MYGLILNADRFTFSFKPSITPKRKLTAEMGGTGPSSNKHTPVSHSQSRKHTPVSDSEYNDYLRPRLPAQGEGASNGSAISLQQTRKPQRIGALADTEGRKPGLTSQLNSHFCWRRRQHGCLRSRLPSQMVVFNGAAHIPEAQFPGRQQCEILAD